MGEFIRHRFGGGWAEDFGPNSDALPDNNRVLTIPFLHTAENLVYDLDGGPKMMGGTARLNSSALESAATIKGLFDYWVTGTGGSPTQHRIVHVDTKVKKDDGDGTFADILTGMAAGAVPSYAVLEDLLVMVNGSDAPRQWDGTTATTLTASPGTLAWVVTHRNRMWGGGAPANPSRLYYSTSLNASDWTGSGSGSIDVDPDDGDGLTGAVSHKGDLFVFKGPKVGSIHRISGSAPTGTDAFARTPFISGIGAVWHNLIFKYRDDIGFMTPDGTVHSLTATASFGDFTEAALSRPIGTFLRDRVTINRLKHAHAVAWPSFGQVLFALPIDGASNNNAIIGFDYRFEPVRWFYWPAFSTLGSSAMALVVDPADSNRRTVMVGGTDGFVRKLGQATKSIDGSTAISYRWRSPFLTYGAPENQKTVEHVGLGVAPRNNGNITFGWTCDDRTEQTESIGQGAGDVLGTAAANQFTLNTSRLGGTRFVDRWAPLSGEFRSIQYRASSSGTANEDCEIHAFSVELDLGGPDTSN